MSLLSDFLQKPYLGLTSAADVLAYTKPLAQHLLWATDSSAGGSTYPRLVLRNAGQSAGYGGEVHFQTNNATPAVFLAAKIKGSLATLTGGAEVGQLDLLASIAGTHHGLSIINGAVRPSVAGVETLGAAAAGFSALYLQASGNTVSVVPGSSSVVAFSSTDFQVQSAGKTYNLAVGARGVGVFCNALPARAMLTIGNSSNTTFFSQSNTTQATGLYVNLGLPASITSEAVMVDAYAQLAATPATLQDLVGFRFAYSGPVGGGASAQTVMGVKVAATGGTVDNVGVFVQSSGWAYIAANAASSFLGKTVISGGSWSSGAAAAQGIVDVRIGSGNTAGILCDHDDTSYAGVQLLLDGPDDDAAYHHIKVSSPGKERFGLRGDGAVTIGTFSQSNLALLTVAGRASFGGSDVYDQASDTRTVDVIIASTHTVPQNKSAMGLRVETTMGLGNTGCTGFGSLIIATATAHIAATQLIGSAVQVASAYAGDMQGILVLASATSGNTGTVVGVSAEVDSQAGTTSAIAFKAQHTGRMHYGVFVNASQAGAQLDHGVYIGNTSNVAVSAFSYRQRSGSTADVLRYTDPSDVAVFRVTSTGNFLTPNFDTFDNGDVAIGPGSLTTSATAGHAYLPAVAGVMTGVPTARSGFTPVVVDIANFKLGIYAGGAWKWTAALS